MRLTERVGRLLPLSKWRVEIEACAKQLELRRILRKQVDPPEHAGRRRGHPLGAVKEFDWS